MERRVGLLLTILLLPTLELPPACAVALIPYPWPVPCKLAIRSAPPSRAPATAESCKRQISRPCDRIYILFGSGEPRYRPRAADPALYPAEWMLLWVG